MTKWTPSRLKLALNLYGPFLGAGVRVKSVSPDWREVEVAMKLRWYNRNAVNVHFGGSLYSMVDPHLMMMLMQCLGKDYVVWDKAAEIEFVAPGRGEVHSTIQLTDERLAEIRDRTSEGERYFPEFEVLILDEGKQIVAKVKKVLYVKKK